MSVFFFLILIQQFLHMRDDFLNLSVRPRLTWKHSFPYMVVSFRMLVFNREFPTWTHEYYISRGLDLC